MANVNEMIKAEANKVSRREALMANLDKQMEATNVLTEKARAKREEELKNNTVIMSVVSSRGYVGLVAGDIAQEIVEPAVVAKAVNKKTGEVMTAPVATLNGVRQALHKAAEYGKDHLILYVNDFEARRISGMLNRIGKGSNEVLTAKEVEHISSPTNASKYGNSYIAYAKGVFLDLKAALEKFKSIRVMGHNAIFGWELKYSNLPLDMENMELTFSKGFASTTFKGRNYRISLASGFKLNGKHKLVKANGSLVVGREIKEGSEQETARDLLSIVNKTIIIKDNTDRSEAIVNEGAGIDAPAEEAVNIDFAA